MLPDCANVTAIEKNNRSQCAPDYRIPIPAIGPISPVFKPENISSGRSAPLALSSSNEQMTPKIRPAKVLRN